jgi:tetratricopeptide (TPR) repeat protein
MTGKNIIILFVAIIASFIAGFAIANSINRSEILSLESDLVKSKTEQKEIAGQTLSIDEIKQRVNEADADPTNIDFQRKLGIALYTYATMKQDPSYLNDISRILARADKNEATDFDLIATIGSVFLDRAISKSENESFAESRKYFERALKIKPDDLKAQGNYASTFLLENPSNPAKAIVGFEKCLAIDATFEPAFEGLIQASILQMNLDKAQEYLGKLKLLNSKNDSIIGFESQIEKLKNK